jgi:hypothetical protein
MQPSAKFRIQRGIDAALTLHPRHAHEGIRYNVNIEMGFAAGAMARVTLMLRAFILNRQKRWCEGECQFLPDRIYNSHNRRLRLGFGAKSSKCFACFLPHHTHNSSMPTPPRPRFKSDIRIKKDNGRKVEPEFAPCAVPGCVKPGNARVPKSRENLTEYVIVCAAHARAFNESWDFFKGMGDGDVQKFREEALFGHRPTWPMGKRAARARNGQGPSQFHDGHAVFDEDGEPIQARRPERQLTRLQSIAMDTLQLAHNATLLEIKARYKELVKRFHPDANGGDRTAEERLKQVIKAYGVLRASGLLS